MATKEEMKAALKKKIEAAMTANPNMSDEALAKIMEDELKAQGLLDKLTVEEKGALKTQLITASKEAIAFKKELDAAINAELGKDNVTEESLAGVIKTTISKRFGTMSAEDTKKLDEESKSMAKVLIQLKKEKGSATAAMKEYSQSVDNTDKQHSFPTGAVIGAAAGFGATMLIDWGNWSSIGGILKKMTLITAGLLGGMLIANDYDIRSTMFGGSQKQDNKGTTL
jgi:hypothetical protein